MTQIPSQQLKSSIPHIISGDQSQNYMNQNPSGQYVSTQQTTPLTQSISQNGFQKPQNGKDTKRRRRSKHELKGRIFACDCGKSFLSQPALNNHKKTKHPELLVGLPKRGRGRPRKYPPKSAGDFESTKYDIFFSQQGRKIEDGAPNDVQAVAEEIFKTIFKSAYSNKLFSRPKKYMENPVLSGIINLNKGKNLFGNKMKSERNCDEVFAEYLNTFKDKTNKRYFSLLVKFIILFRECYDLSANKEKKDGERCAVTNKLTPEGLPDLCNEFYGEFMEPNDFFGLTEDERVEIVEIIQHFCIWLFKNDYTKSKLSLAS